MRGIRIRWKGLARVVAAVVACVLALRVLPGLLQPPDPPPLGADVGLPRLTVETTAPRDRARRRGAKLPHGERKSSGPRPGEAVIGTRPRHRKRRAKAKRHADSPPSHRFEPEPEGGSTAAPGSTTTSPPAPEAPAPAPSATAAPASPEPPPSDGSEEFAPR